MVYEKDLMPRLAREMGDTNTSNLYYSANMLFSGINDGLADFNLQTPDTQYTVIGSGDAAYFSPDPSIEDQQLLVLCAAIVMTRGEIQKAARTAYSHSNPAGNTNLQRIPEMLDMQARRLEDRVQNIFLNRSRRLVESESCGTELKGAATEVAEGVGITVIETTN